MGETLAQKIIRAHLLHGDMTPGSEIALRIDQTLTQDATGTMAYLEFETMGIPRVRTELSGEIAPERERRHGLASVAQARLDAADGLELVPHGRRDPTDIWQQSDVDEPVEAAGSRSLGKVVEGNETVGLAATE